MNRNEKIKLAITSGIAAVILLLAVLLVALSGKKGVSDEKKLDDSIAEYISDTGSSEDADDKDPADVIASADDASSKESSSKEDNASKDATDKKDELVYSEYKDPAKGSISGNSFYATKEAVLKDVYKGVKYDTNEQLREMHRYWSDGNTEAVRDLAHLDRFEAMSYSLTGTNDYYYFGDTGSDGQPNGTGLAVYASDQYYFGQWVNGKRSGDGSWISFFPSYSTYVVTEHTYTGQWSDDLPNGKGQEHYDYNDIYMNSKDVYVQNAIGGFAKGLYNGEMYIITVNKDGETTEWTGNCKNGKLEQVMNASLDDKGLIPVLSERENTERHLYMSKDKTKDNGVDNIVSGGNKR
ncbi:MAG: hypothetical protein K6G10_05190 [Butyrivibrio sp.]|nr:hypothetical protein [Butyrivibrio sp.]